MLKKVQIDRMAELTATHDDNYIYAKASEELQELSLELLHYIKFANIQSGRKETVTRVVREIVDVHLVLSMADSRLGHTIKDIGSKLREKIETEIKDGGVWGLASGVQDTAAQLINLSKLYTQMLTKNQYYNTEFKMDTHKANMDVRCHLYKLGLIFFLFEQHFDLIASEKMDKLEEYNKTIAAFGTIQNKNNG